MYRNVQTWQYDYHQIRSPWVLYQSDRVHILGSKVKACTSCSLHSITPRRFSSGLPGLNLPKAQYRDLSPRLQSSWAEVSVMLLTARAMLRMLRPLFVLFAALLSPPQRLSSFFLAEGLKVITDAVHSICITTKAAWHIIISERCSLVYSIYIERFMQHGSREDVRWQWKAGERRAQGEVRTHMLRNHINTMAHACITSTKAVTWQPFYFLTMSPVQR